LTSLVILDLGYGNTRSVALAFERLGQQPILTSDPSVAASAELLVMPGVGAASSAMTRFRETGMDEVVRCRTAPTLGICLGMQLLFEESQEDSGTALLGLLPGSVAALEPAPSAPVPNMGWCALSDVQPALGITEGEHLYFAHGFACPDGPYTAAKAMHGNIAFPAIVRSGPLWGAQFHPERSSAAGARFLSAFLSS
jgi:glutamine amidotransferase